MSRDDVIARLREHETELRHVGDGGLYLFGSAARGQATAQSDVDLFFDLAKPHGFTLFSLAALRDRMQEMLGARVDLMTRKAIHPRRRPRIEVQAVKIF